MEMVLSKEQEPEYVRDKDLYLLVDSGFGGSLSAVHRPRYFESDGAKETILEDFSSVYGLFLTTFSICRKRV